MLRRVLLALCALALASTGAYAQLLPGRAPGFRPGFQFLNSWVAPGAVYDADLVQGLYTAGPPSVSRASPGYAADISGTYSFFGADTLRRTNVGATVEVADTNYIANNAMVGAAAGNPGAFPNGWTGGLSGNGLAQQVVGLSTQRGADCLDLRVSGTTTSASAAVVYFGPNFNQTSAAPGQLHTLSSFGVLVGGSFSGVLTLDLVIRENDNAPAFLRQTQISLLGLTSTLQRIAGSVTTGASTAGVATGIRIAYSSGAIIDFTLRQCWPHGSQSVRALSPIRTTSGAVTRQADVVTLPVAGVGRVVITYDDGSTQTFSGIPTATPWTIPAANLNRSVIRRLTGYAS